MFNEKKYLKHDYWIIVVIYIIIVIVFYLLNLLVKERLILLICIIIGIIINRILLYFVDKGIKKFFKERKGMICENKEINKNFLWGKDIRYYWKVFISIYFMQNIFIYLIEEIDVKLYYIIRRLNKWFSNNIKINIIVIWVMISLVYDPIKIIIGFYYKLKNNLCIEDLFLKFFWKIYGLIVFIIFISIFFDYVIYFFLFFKIIYLYIILIILSLFYHFTKSYYEKFWKYKIRDKISWAFNIEIKFESSIVGIIVKEILNNMYFSQVKVNFDYNYYYILSRVFKYTFVILEEKKWFADYYLKNRLGKRIYSIKYMKNEIKNKIPFFLLDMYSVEGKGFDCGDLLEINYLYLFRFINFSKEKNEILLYIKDKREEKFRYYLYKIWELERIIGVGFKNNFEIIEIYLKYRLINKTDYYESENINLKGENSDMIDIEDNYEVYLKLVEEMILKFNWYAESHDILVEKMNEYNEICYNYFGIFRWDSDIEKSVLYLVFVEVNKFIEKERKKWEELDKKGEINFFGKKDK
jgi:hypothetical protein